MICGKHRPDSRAWLAIAIPTAAWASYACVDGEIVLVTFSYALLAGDASSSTPLAFNGLPRRTYIALGGAPPVRWSRRCPS